MLASTGHSGRMPTAKSSTMSSLPTWGDDAPEKASSGVGANPNGCSNVLLEAGFRAIVCRPQEGGQGVMEIPLFQVDAFTDRPFSGNPAAVCLLPGPHEESWMQAVAAEMNLSETAFLVEEGDGYRLRWFTPKIQVDLCGHATLASAHVLWTEGRVPLDMAISFRTNSGLLKAVRRGDLIELDFPLDPPSEITPPPDLLPALGISAEYVGKGKFDYLVEVESEQIVRLMKPDFARLVQIEMRGVIVTARSSSPEYDFVSRFFAPRVGVDEDPVTGSAHCCLGAYWNARLSKSEFTAYQASARGGVVQVRINGNRAYLGGQAVTVLRGELVCNSGGCPTPIRRCDHNE